LLSPYTCGKQSSHGPSGRTVLPILYGVHVDNRGGWSFHTCEVICTLVTSSSTLAANQRADILLPRMEVSHEAGLFDKSGHIRIGSQRHSEGMTSEEWREPRGHEQPHYMAGQEL
jgi:hypothetical protein